MVAVVVTLTTDFACLVASRSSVPVELVFVVEDEVTQTVPVRKEVVQLETDPPPEGTIESVEDVDDEQRP